MSDYDASGRTAGRYTSYQVGRNPLVFKIYDKAKEAATRGYASQHPAPTTRLELMMMTDAIKRKICREERLTITNLQEKMGPIISGELSPFSGITLYRVAPRSLTDFSTAKKLKAAIEFHRDLETGTFFDVRRLMDEGGNGGMDKYRKFFLIRRLPHNQQPAELLRRGLANYFQVDLPLPAQQPIQALRPHRPLPRAMIMTGTTAADF